MCCRRLLRVCCHGRCCQMIPVVPQRPTQSLQMAKKHSTVMNKRRQARERLLTCPATRPADTLELGAQAINAHLAQKQAVAAPSASATNSIIHCHPTFPYIALPPPISSERLLLSYTPAFPPNVSVCLVLPRLDARSHGRLPSLLHDDLNNQHQSLTTTSHARRHPPR